MQVGKISFRPAYQSSI